MTPPSSLLVDATVRDAYAYPPGVLEHLRTLERSIRGMLERLAAANEEVPIAAVRSALTRVEQWLLDDGSGILLRVLRRPPHHLSSGAPARRRIDRSADALIETSERALAVHAELSLLRVELCDIRARFSERFPHFMENLLSAAHVSVPDLERAMFPGEVVRMRGLLARARQVLDGFALAMYGSTDAALLDARSDALLSQALTAPKLTLDELRAARQVRFARRDATRRLVELRSLGRFDLARQVLELGSLASSEPRRSTYAASGAVSESIVKRSLDDVSSESSGKTSDVPIWLGLLGGARNAVFEQPQCYTWRPAGILELPDGESSDPATEEDALAYHAIPLGGEYVWLSRDGTSSVRVWSADIAVGGTVECTVAARRATIPSLDLVELDIAPLFDGLVPLTSAWYRTMRRASLSVVSADDGGWFARVTHPGAVKQLRDAASREVISNRGAFRVREEPRVTWNGEPSYSINRDIAVEATSEVRSFLGFQTVTVVTSLVGHQHAWVRSCEHAPYGADRLERERVLLLRLRGVSLERGGSPLGITPIGRARLDDRGPGVPLFAIPQGMRTLDSPDVESWLRSSSSTRFATMRSVARIILAAHRQGFALGECHLNNFAFAPEWRRIDANPEPVATLVCAPMAAGFGERTTSPGSEADKLFDHLRLPIVPQGRMMDAVHAPLRDAASFAAFTLDLFADDLPINRRIGWDVLADIACDESTRFAVPSLARALAGTLKSEAGLARVLSALLLLSRDPELTLDAFTTHLAG